MKLQNQIYIMRHGQSENNVLGIESCLAETQMVFGLTDQGQQQVQNAATEFSDFDVIYTSPFRRTIETAEIMAQTSRCEVFIEARLQEFRLPSRFDQTPYEEAEALIHDPETDLQNNQIEDSESFQQMFDRVQDALQQIDQLHSDKKILLVSHGSPVEAAFQVMRGQCTGFGPFENLPKNAEVTLLNSVNHV